MIPLIIAGIAVTASGGLVTYAAKEVNKDLTAELNSINEDIRKMATETERNMKETQHDFEEVCERLSLQRIRIKRNTLKSFKKCAANIKNPDLKRMNISKEEFRYFQTTIIEYKSNDVLVPIVPSGVSTIATEILFGGVGLGISFVSQFVKGISLGYKIDEANAQKAKVREECAKINAKCTQIKGATRFCNTTFETIETLKKLETEYIKKANQILQKKGCNYRCFSESEKNIIMTMYNLGFALNDLISIQILTKNGNVSTKFRKYVGGAKLLAGE